MENTAMKNINKIPVQVYLEPEQMKAVSLLSKSSGKSKAAVIRLCISKFISELPVEDDPALNIMGLGASGKSDIAQKHDDYLISYTKEHC